MHALDLAIKDGDLVSFNTWIDRMLGLQPSDRALSAQPEAC
jgi:hypothetical protein